MKKFILAAFVAATSICANAQVWMGGSLGFNINNSKASDVQTTSFEIAPTVGYTLSDKWDIALELAYRNVSTDVKGSKSVDTFEIMPFARYTFAKSGIASFFVDGGVGVGSTASDNTTFKVGLRPGVKVELSHKVELDAKLGWFGYDNVENVGNNFGLNVNNEALSFGMTWKF